MKYYCIGIKGSGMSTLAQILFDLGNEVSGYDDTKEYKFTQEGLDKRGIKIYTDGNHEIDKDTIVTYSKAFSTDHPEIKRVEALGLKIVPYNELLGKLSSQFKTIGVSGTHGKTTTSGLSSYVMEKAGLEPSYVVGGIIPELHTNANYKTDNYFIAELDESDGTIVKYNPQILVINNLEADHLDFYKNGLDSLVETFEQLLSKFDGSQKVLINNDSAGNLKLKGYNFITFGLNDADYVAKNINLTPTGSTFDIYYKGEKLVSLRIKLLGRHNVSNALGVLASLHQAGVDIEKGNCFLCILEIF